MTDDDYANLRFLMTSSPEVLAHWYSTVSEDDLKYAEALLEIASLEVTDVEVDFCQDLKDAKDLLSRIMNK